MSSNYKRLGDYIREVNVRNVGNISERPLGLSIDKYFMPSVANIIGTDLTKYKVIKKGQFACNLIHVGRDGGIPLALYTFDTPNIVSSAYKIFEVINTKELLPEYLMLWFSRSEFDREAAFYTDGDIRQQLQLSDLCDVQLPIPLLPTQQKIVDQYQTIQRRIDDLKAINSKLEETAQTIFRKMFVGNEDVENELKLTLGDVCDIKIGRTPPRQDVMAFSNTDGIKWVSIADLDGTSMFINNTSERLTDYALANYKIPTIPPNTVILSFKMTVGRVAITNENMMSNEAIAQLVIKTTISNEFLYVFLKQYDYKTMGSTSSIVNSVNSGMIKSIKLPYLSAVVVDAFTKSTSPFFDIIRANEQELSKLTQLQTLLLSRISTISEVSQ